MNNRTKACKTLSLALTYAEDGAVISAIEYGTEAMALLYLERDRRRAAGLIPAPNPIGAELVDVAAKSNAALNKARKTRKRK